MKNQPKQVDPSKDIDEEKKLQDLKEIELHRKIEESSTTGNPQRQQQSPTKVINPFSND